MGEERKIRSAILVPFDKAMLTKKSAANLFTQLIGRAVNEAGLKRDTYLTTEIVEGSQGCFCTRLEAGDETYAIHPRAGGAHRSLGLTPIRLIGARHRYDITYARLVEFLRTKAVRLNLN